MVLEDSSASNPSNSFTDSAPASDSDPYSDSRREVLYAIDGTKFPKGIPIISSMFGYNPTILQKLLTERVQRVIPVLGRMPTEEESNALAYWSAKQLQIVSIAMPVGIAGGWYRAWTTRATYRFPFYQPNMETFHPDVFPLQRLAILKGGRAMLGWHCLRTFWYGIAGGFFGTILGSSYSSSVVAVGELSDPRLKALKDAIRTKVQQRQGSLSGTQRNPARGGQPDDGGQPAGTQYGTRDGADVDDASPTGGMFREDFTASSPERESGNTAGNAPLARTAPTPVRTQDNEDRPFDAWDDASPTGGQGMAEGTAPTSTTSGSAWERLRRGEKPAPIPSKTNPQSPVNRTPWSKQQIETQREQSEGSAMDDSFAFSKTEEERSYAREEAQKEFDARVERERRGGDFSQGNGDQKRW